MDAFYSDHQAMRNAEKARNATSPQLIPRLTALFEKYAGGKGKDTIPIDGTLAWCADLGVEPEDPVMLAVAELCSASEMGSFERKGWIDGWAKQKCDLLYTLVARLESLHRKDTLDGQKELLKTLRENMKTRPDVFKKIYEFAFAYAKLPEQRSMPLDTAAPMWQLLIPLMPASMFKESSAWNAHDDPDGAEEWLEKWINFLTEENKARPISKDCWMQVGSFSLPLYCVLTQSSFSTLQQKWMIRSLPMMPMLLGQAPWTRLSSTKRSIRQTRCRNR